MITMSKAESDILGLAVVQSCLHHHGSTLTTIIPYLLCPLSYNFYAEKMYTFLLDFEFVEEHIVFEKKKVFTQDQKYHLAHRSIMMSLS
jgi:hypothetical protein